MVNKEVSQTPEKARGFFYGHFVVIVAFFIMLVGYGLYTVFGVFFDPLINEFDWTRATTSGAFSISMILSGVLGVVMGGLNDRFGPRIVLTVCGCFVGIGFLLMSQVDSVWQLYLFYGVIIGIGISGIWVPLLSSVARWFVKRRSLMTGIVIAGTGIGGLIWPPVVIRLISNYDWRVSYIILGVVILFVVVVASQFMRRDPGQMRQLPYGEGKAKETGLKLEAEGFSLREAALTNQFWLVLIMFFCFGFALFAYMVHIVPHAIELGISPVNASNVLATMGGMTVIGNFVLGNIGDRIGNRQLFIIGFVLWAVLLFCLVRASEMWMLYVIAVVFGFIHGGMGASESPIVARVFGLRSHGLIFGVMGLGFTFGAAAGPYVMGYIFDVTGSYYIAFGVCAAISVIGLILSVILRPTKRLGIKL